MLKGILQQSGPGTDVDLVEDSMEVTLNGTAADPQFDRDRLIGQTVIDQVGVPIGATDGATDGTTDSITDRITSGWTTASARWCPAQTAWWGRWICLFWVWAQAAQPCRPRR